MGERGCCKRKVHYLSLKTPHVVRVPCGEGNMGTIKDTGEGNERNNTL